MRVQPGLINDGVLPHGLAKEVARVNLKKVELFTVGSDSPLFLVVMCVEVPGWIGRSEFDLRLLVSKVAIVVAPDRVDLKVCEGGTRSEESHHVFQFLLGRILSNSGIQIVTDGHKEIKIFDRVFASIDFHLIDCVENSVGSLHVASIGEIANDHETNTVFSGDSCC